MNFVSRACNRPKYALFSDSFNSRKLCKAWRMRSMAAFWLREMDESLPSSTITEECNGEWNWSSSPMPDQCSPPDAPDPDELEPDEDPDEPEPDGGLDRPEDPAPVVAPAMAWAATAN